MFKHVLEKQVWVSVMQLRCPAGLGCTASETCGTKAFLLGFCAAPQVLGALAHADA